MSSTLGLFFVMMAAGYAFMGWDILVNGAVNTSGFRHLITSGGYGLALSYGYDDCRMDSHRTPSHK